MLWLQHGEHGSWLAQCGELSGRENVLSAETGAGDWAKLGFISVGCRDYRGVFFVSF